MSLMKVEHAMDRIQSAPKESPILVMRSWERGHVNAVFASTVESARLIRSRDPSVIGVFDSSDDRDSVRRKLESAIGESIRETVKA